VLAGWKFFVSFNLYNYRKERSKRLTSIQKKFQKASQRASKKKIDSALLHALLAQLGQEEDEKKLEWQLAEKELQYWTGKKIELSELPTQIPEPAELVSEVEFEIQKHPEILEARSQMQVAALESELALKERRPNIFLGGGYRLERTAPDNHFYYGVVGIKLPIWDTGKHKLESARAREHRYQYLRTAAERRVQHELNKELAHLRYQVEQLKRYPFASVKTYEELIQEAEEGYRRGEVDLNSYLETQSRAHEFIDKVFLSWLVYLERLADLQQ